MAKRSKWTKAELDEIASVGADQLYEGQKTGSVKSYYVEGHSRKVRVNWTAWNRYYEQFKLVWGRDRAARRKKPSLLRRVLNAFTS